MAGFQFAHMENFSRKGDKGGRTSDLKLTSPIGAIRKVPDFRLSAQCGVYCEATSIQYD